LNLLDVCDEVLRSHTPDLEKRKAFFNTLLVASDDGKPVWKQVEAGQ
jgi:hypothetical protein